MTDGAVPEDMSWTVTPGTTPLTGTVACLSQGEPHGTVARPTTPTLYPIASGGGNHRRKDGLRTSAGKQSGNQLVAGNHRLGGNSRLGEHASGTVDGRVHQHVGNRIGGVGTGREGRGVVGEHE
jgi:hypothetical protein